MTQTRYALYFAPEDGSALAQFGASWLGRRPETPDLAELPHIGFDPARQREIVAEARLYGFHATLKPPFRLAAGCRPADLTDAASAFCAQRAPFTTPPLVLAELEGFVALRPSRPAPAINSLADDCVRHFDRLRAPATPQERAKRLIQPLTPRQRHHLDEWGYPYVFEDYRFHMTLTYRLEAIERAMGISVLQSHLGPVLAEPVAFSSLAVFTQAEPGAPFVLMRRFPFAG